MSMPHTHTHTHTHTHFFCVNCFYMLALNNVATVQKLEGISRLTMLIRIYINGNFALTCILNYTLRATNL